MMILSGMATDRWLQFLCNYVAINDFTFWFDQSHVVPMTDWLISLEIDFLNRFLLEIIIDVLLYVFYVWSKRFIATEREKQISFFFSDLHFFLF